jgi:hypothetical protein
VHTTLWKWMTKNSVFLMTSWKRQVPQSTKWCLRNQNYDTRKNWKYLHNGRPRSREKTKAASAWLFNVESTLFVFQNVYISRYPGSTVSPPFRKQNVETISRKKLQLLQETMFASFYWKRRTKSGSFRKLY